MMHADIAVIGAGIAGASAAYALSRFGRVVILDAEDAPAYHTTGRSAATFTANYGNGVVRGLTLASADFLHNPPDGFTDHPLLTPGGCLHIAGSGQMESFRRSLAEAQALVPAIHEVSVEAAVAMMPILDPEAIAAAHFEPDAAFLDVDLLHRGFLRGAFDRQARLLCSAPVRAIDRVDGIWRLVTGSREHRYVEAPVLVNAAGAWADEIAILAGARPIGLVPKRRTVVIVAPPPDRPVTGGPLVLDVDENFYFRPEAGKILASPADETPSPPCDARPEDIDVAKAVDRLERATTLSVRRVEHKWAGLRSFVVDKSPVLGADPEVDGFYWLAAQGGYGIMISPALAEALSAAVTGAPWPETLKAHRVTAGQLSPARLSTVQPKAAHG